MAVTIDLSCDRASFLAVRDAKLTLITLDDPATAATPKWELSFNFSSNSWSLSYPSTNFGLELLQSKVIRELGGSARESLEVVVDNGTRHLRFASGATGPGLGLELTEDGKDVATPVSVRDTSGNVLDINLTLSKKSFDYVVIGSSFCGYTFVHQTSPNKKILLLEAGDLDLRQHHQSVPPRPGKTANDVAVRPWSVSQRMQQEKEQPIHQLHGQIPYYGGRSTYWSAWCPEPSDAELEHWPEEMKNGFREYFRKAKELLGVIPANKVKEKDGVYGSLQDFLQELFPVDSVIDVQPAPLAMGNEGFQKFSTPKPLSQIKSDGLTTVLNCKVSKIEHDGKRATGLHTSQGFLLLGNAKLILAMSTLPSTLLVLNSFTKEQFPSLFNVGTRLTAHFVSSIYARIPRKNLFPGTETQLGAVYIAGKAEAQYHLQLSALATSSDPENDKKLCREFSANSIPQECIESSPEHVIIACSALGELDHTNEKNWFRLKEGAPAGDNGELQIIPNEQDLELWGTMDDVMFKIIEGYLSSSVEYWHEKVKEWKTDRPKDIRSKNVVHDASTMWVGGKEDKGAPVGLDYRLRGVDNVYVTGGALWPTGGSWNPVLTIVAMAMHLADMLYCPSANENDG